ncbi:MAG: response regulator transcription factor [Candidatus Helarchaeota archaeon]
MKAKILVVDDEPDVIELVTQILEKEDYQILTANDGEEALQKVHQEHPQVVLLDILLPKKNGYEICQEIKSDKNLLNTIVVMLTVKAFDSDRKQALQVGADYYFTKPFSAVSLLAFLQNILETS